MYPPFRLTAKEFRLLNALSSPYKIQLFLDKLDYNLEEAGETLYSPRMVLRNRKADCIEGGIFAAAALMLQGHRPQIVGLTAVRDDYHVIAVFKKLNLWGSVSKSKYVGLRMREPVYRTLRELVISYFNDYYNFNGERSLRGFTQPLNLVRFDKINWMTTEENLFVIDQTLFGKGKSTRLFPISVDAHLSDLTSVAMRAGELWMREQGIYSKAKH